MKNAENTGFIPGLEPAKRPENRLKQSIIAFFEDLEKKRELSIAETTKKTILIEMADSVGAHLGYGRLSVADQKALEHITTILDSIPVPTGGTDPELDALTKTLDRLTVNAFDTWEKELSNG